MVERIDQDLAQRHELKAQRELMEAHFDAVHARIDDMHKRFNEMGLIGGGFVFLVVLMTVYKFIV